MNRYHRLITFVSLALFISSFLLCPAAAAPRQVAADNDEGVRVFINDLYFNVDTAAVDDEGTPYLPFRAIYELLGADVTWIAEKRTARGERGSITVDLQVDNGVAVVNKDQVILDISSKLKDGKTLVPGWFFAQSLGADIDWDENERVINISLEPVRGISLESREMTLEQGETEELMADVHPDNAVNQNIIWFSSHPSVVDVHDTGNSSAVISAVNPGTAIIIAQTEEGDFVATCRVKVEQPYTPVTGVRLSHSSLTLVAGNTPRVIHAEVIPEAATDKEIHWDSSDDSVATVQKHAVGRAIITPLEEGRTIITVTTEDGEYVDVCIVNVLD